MDVTNQFPEIDIFLPSMPRIITWWITPGASNLASLGIMAFILYFYAHVNYLFMDCPPLEKRDFLSSILSVVKDLRDDPLVLLRAEVFLQVFGF